MINSISLNGSATSEKQRQTKLKWLPNLVAEEPAKIGW